MSSNNIQLCQWHIFYIVKVRSCKCMCFDFAREIFNRHVFNPIQFDLVLVHQLTTLVTNRIHVVPS